MFFFPKASFPPKFPRMLDFIPSLNIQSMLDPDLSICALKASFSMSFKGILAKGIMKENAYIGPSGAPTQPGMFAWPVTRRDMKGKKRLLYSWSDRPPKELLDFVRDESGGAYDVAIKRLAIKCKLPKSLEDNKLFDGTESLMFFLSGRGNHPRRYSRMLGLPFWNPYRHFANALITENIVRKGDKSLRMIRSTLMIDNLVTDDGKGWGEFISEVDKRHRFSKTLLMAQSLPSEKWWRDMAYSSQTTTFINTYGEPTTAEPLCIYYLMKQGKRVCYPLNPT